MPTTTSKVIVSTGSHLFVWTLVAGLYASVFLSLYRLRWSAIDYTHAYFILPVSLFVAWTCRAAITADWNKRPTTSDQGLTTKDQRRFFGNGLTPLLIFAAGLAMFIFGRRGDYLFLSTLSLIPVLGGLVGYLYGPAIARTLRFPILYLLLLVPPPLGVLDNITLPMRYLTSVAAEHLLRLAHYPIIREGLLLRIGGQEIFLGEACSGLRSLVTMLALGLVYIYFNRGGRRKNALLTAALIPLAIVGNFIRVLALCLVTFHFGQEAGQGFFHNLSGVVVFVIMILGLMGLEKVISKRL